MFRTHLASLAAGLLLTACASRIEVTDDYDPDIDFSDFDTYVWSGDPPTVNSAWLDNDLLHQQIEQAADAQLQAKGISQINTSRASFALTYHIDIEQKIQFNDPYYSYDMETEYEQGTLIFDVSAPTDGRLLWRGSGQTRLLNYKTREAREQRVREVVAAIFARFPPE